jgi:hypothetical protein
LNLPKLAAPGEKTTTFPATDSRLAILIHSDKSEPISNGTLFFSDNFTNLSFD